MRAIPLSVDVPVIVRWLFVGSTNDMLTGILSIGQPENT
jgi:hypothetical protein